MFIEKCRGVVTLFFVVIALLFSYQTADATCGGFDIPGLVWLQNGVTVNNIWMNMDDSRSFVFQTPDNVTQLDIKAWGGKGEADLELDCVDYTVEDEEHWSDKWSGPESITLLYPQCDCWLVILWADDTITGWNLKATYKATGDTPDPSTSSPDLTGTWLSLNQKCNNTKKGPKCKMSGKIAIQNVGNKNALSSIVNFYLSDNSTYDARDTLLKGVATGNVKVGKSNNKNLTYSFPLGQTTTGKYIIAVIDSGKKIFESNEGNNNISYGPMP